MGVSGAGGLEVVALVHRARFAREAKGENPTSDLPLTVARAREYDREVFGSGAPMSPRDTTSTPQTHGDLLTAISEGMVALLKEFYGRGPTRTKTYYCLLYTSPSPRDRS